MEGAGIPRSPKLRSVRFFAEAHRECGSNGTWLHGNWTNYTECLELLPQSGPSNIPAIASYILLVFSLVSLVALCVTLFIFTYFNAIIVLRGCKPASALQQAITEACIRAALAAIPLSSGPA
ncbi:hypothetical protein MTO96_014389 [Rhipicephalus appendiculatus]